MAIREYVGARYVPRFLGTYSPTTIYDALDVVDDGMGTSYIARKTTPAGTPLNDTTYWFVYGASSGAIISLQNRMTAAENDITAIQDRSSVLPDLYDALTTYAANDYVVYQGKVYQAIAPSTGVLPTNSAYWVNKGSIEKQFEDVYTELGLKAAKTAFTPTDVNLSPIDFSTYGSLKLECKQVGRILILTIAITVNLGVALPANTVLNGVAVPGNIPNNIGFPIMADSPTPGSVYRLLLNTSGMISNLPSLPSGNTYEGQLIIPSAGWI